MLAEAVRPACLEKKVTLNSFGIDVFLFIWTTSFNWPNICVTSDQGVRRCTCVCIFGRLTSSPFPYGFFLHHSFPAPGKDRKKKTERASRLDFLCTYEQSVSIVDVEAQNRNAMIPLRSPKIAVDSKASPIHTFTFMHNKLPSERRTQFASPTSTAATSTTSTSLLRPIRCSPLPSVCLLPAAAFLKSFRSPFRSLKQYIL